MISVCARNRLFVSPTLRISRKQSLKRSAAIVVNHQKSRATEVLSSHVNAFNSDSIAFANSWLVALVMGQSRPWSDRYLFSAFNASQRLSTLFNTLQLDSTLEELAVLKRVEHLSAVTFRTSLEGRSTRSVGRELLSVKQSVSVQAFTCNSLLTG